MAGRAGAGGRRDRQTQRTRRALRDAFLALLIERGFDEVGVREICERADVGRSTFYMHFESKQALLDGSLDDLREELRRQAATSNEPTSVLAFARGLIVHVHEQRRLFRAVIGRRSGHVVQARFRAMVHELVQDNFSSFVRAGWQRDAASHFVSGAIVQTLAWWVDAKPLVSAEAVEELLFQFTTEIVQQLS